MTTFLGNPVTFTGKQLQVGDTAHDFSLDSNGSIKENSGWLCWQRKFWASSHLSILVSARLQTRRFNQELSDLTIPLSQFQLIAFCTRQVVRLLKALRMLLCYRLLRPFFFGRDYAVLINEWHLWPAQFSFWMRTTLWPMPNMSTISTLNLTMMRQ